MQVYERLMDKYPDATVLSLWAYLDYCCELLRTSWSHLNPLFPQVMSPRHVYKQKVNIESNHWKGQLCVWKQVAVLCQDQESSKCLPYCCCRAVLLFVLLCVAACIVGMNVWGQVRVFSFWIWGNSDGQIGPMRKWWANWGHYSFDNSNNFKSSNDHSFGGFEKGHTPATFRQLYLFG